MVSAHYLDQYLDGYLVQGRYYKVRVGKKDWCTMSAIVKTTVSNHKIYLAGCSIALSSDSERGRQWDSGSIEAHVGVEFGWLRTCRRLSLYLCFFS